MWLEDDATVFTEGHESLPAAWERITGNRWNPAAALWHADHGDMTEYEFPEYSVQSAYPGNSSIFRKEMRSE